MKLRRSLRTRGQSTTSSSAGNLTIISQYAHGDLITLASESESPTSMPSARSTATVIASLAKSNRQHRGAKRLVFDEEAKKTSKKKKKEREEIVVTPHTESSGSEYNFQQDESVVSTDTNVQAEVLEPPPKLNKAKNTIQKKTASRSITDKPSGVEKPAKTTASLNGGTPIATQANANTTKKVRHPISELETVTTTTDSRNAVVRESTQESRVLDHVEDSEQRNSTADAHPDRPLHFSGKNRRRGVRWSSAEVEYIKSMIHTHGGRWTYIANEGVKAGILYRGRTGHDVQDKWRIIRKTGDEIPEEACKVAEKHRRPWKPWSDEDTAFLIKMRKVHGNRFILMLEEGQSNGYFMDKDARQLKEKVRNIEKAKTEWMPKKEINKKKTMEAIVTTSNEEEINASISDGIDDNGDVVVEEGQVDDLATLSESESPTPNQLVTATSHLGMDMEEQSNQLESEIHHDIQTPQPNDRKKTKNRKSLEIENRQYNPEKRTKRSKKRALSLDTTREFPQQGRGILFAMNNDMLTQTDSIRNESQDILPNIFAHEPKGDSFSNENSCHEMKNEPKMENYDIKDENHPNTERVMIIIHICHRNDMSKVEKLDCRVKYTHTFQNAVKKVIPDEWKDEPANVFYDGRKVPLDNLITDWMREGEAMKIVVG